MVNAEKPPSDIHDPIPTKRVAQNHGRRMGHSSEPGITSGLPGAPSASAEPRNIGQAHGKRAEGGFAGLGLLGKDCQSAANTSSACSAGFTAGQTFLILPSGPIRKVTRWVPRLQTLAFGLEDGCALNWRLPSQT